MILVGFQRILEWAFSGRFLTILEWIGQFQSEELQNVVEHVHYLIKSFICQNYFLDSQQAVVFQTGIAVSNSPAYQNIKLKELGHVM